MIIGKGFVWSHFPKTGGTSTRAMFNVINDVIIKEYKQLDMTHKRFAEFEFDKKSKKILNIRRLPHFAISTAFEHQNNSGIPFDKAKLLEEGALQSHTNGKLGSFKLNNSIRNFMCGNVDHWLRTEFLANDFIKTMKRFGHISSHQKAIIKNIHQNKGNYHHAIDRYLTKEEINILYALCQFWTVMEKKIYGNIFNPDPRITIGTGWVGKDYNELGSFSLARNEEYAKDNGYNFVYFKEPLSKIELKYHKYMQKFHLILEQLDSCDWFVWIDADAIFLRNAGPIKSVINDEYYLIMQADLIPPKWPNTGMMIIKSCEKSKEFCKKALEISLLEITKFANKKHHPVLWDQTAAYVVLENQYFRSDFKTFKYGDIWVQPHHSKGFANTLAVHCTDGTLQTLGIRKEHIKAKHKIDILKKTFNTTSIQVRHLEAITVCVNYSDYLRIAIKENKKHFDRWVVVTNAEDIDTQTLCKKHNIEYIITNRLYENGDVFNKGKAINDGLKYLKENWVLVLDSDILLTKGFRERFDKMALNPSFLYGAVRLKPKSMSDLSDYLKGEFDSQKWEDHDSWKHEKGWWHPGGYFQLFMRQATMLKNRGNAIFSEDYSDIHGYDDEFINLWPSKKLSFKWNVIHIPPGNKEQLKKLN